MTVTAVSADEAMRRVTADYDALTSALDAAGAQGLTQPYQVHGGPLGDFCDTLHDLLAHLLMWDEIGLAVLTEMRAGRVHWSVEPRWEDPDAGRHLNRAGVAAGRELPAVLLRHRFDRAHQALLAELGALDGDRWTAPVGLAGYEAQDTGSFVEQAMSVPGQAPFTHASVHLGPATESA